MTRDNKIDATQNATLRSLSDHQAERATLGVLLSQRDRAFSLIDSVKEGDFYDQHHRAIYSAAAELIRASKTVDEVTVSDALRGKGGDETWASRQELAALISQRFGAAAQNSYVDIIKRHSVSRQLVVACQESIEQLFDGDSDETHFSAIEQKLLGVTQRRTMGTHVATREALFSAFNYMEEARKAGGRIVGIPSGILEYDIITKGFRKKTLQVVAGRPGMGKSTFAMQCALHAAIERGTPIAIFTYEMDACEIMLRMLANIGRVDAERVLTGDVSTTDHAKLTKAANEISKGKFMFIAAHGMNVFDIVSKARRLQVEHGIKMVIVDYIQAVARIRGDSHEREIAQITEYLKQMAGEMDIPVMALSQLNRQSERTEDKRPEMSHLLASGKIEADADVVTLLYREEYYKEDVKNNILELIVAKNRGGQTGTVEASWSGRHYRIDRLVKTDYSKGF